MMINKSAYLRLKAELDALGVELVAVSKMKSVEEIRAIYDTGQRIFGENRAQELAEKHSALPDDIRWHMIGHLQRNKVKYIADFVTMIESVDSVRLLNKIQREAQDAERQIDILLQLKIAQEESKYGFELSELESFLGSADFNKYNHIRFRGVMGMASFVEDEQQIREEFHSLKLAYDKLKGTVFQDKKEFDVVSMGMSGDYKLAVEEGSTMVRIGSLIFGPREGTG